LVINKLHRSDYGGNPLSSPVWHAPNGRPSNRHMLIFKERQNDDIILLADIDFMGHMAVKRDAVVRPLDRTVDLEPDHMSA